MEATEIMMFTTADDARLYADTFAGHPGVFAGYRGWSDLYEAYIVTLSHFSLD